MAQTDLPPHAEIVRRHDPDRFLTALFAPPSRRDTLMTLYAFNHETARAREATREPGLALIRLQWWREVVEGQPRRHEVATPLSAALAQGRLATEPLLAILDAREVEAEDRMETLDGWRAYVTGTAGALARAAGLALGADSDALTRIEALGTAYGVAGQLRNIEALARHGRCMLPADLLARHGATPEDVVADPAKARAVTAELAAFGRERVRSGAGRFRGDVIAAALPGVLARRDLARAPSIGPRARSDKVAVTLAALRGRVAT